LIFWVLTEFFSISAHVHKRYTNLSSKQPFAQQLLDQPSFTQALSGFRDFLLSLLIVGGGTFLAIMYCEINANGRRELHPL
jgi:hypothetical protein